MRSLVALFISAVCLVATAQEVSSIRDSQYEWQCEDADGNRISGHTRQDKAFESCYNSALANPARTYFVQGGRFRISATGGTEVPPTEPPIEPNPPTEPPPVTIPPDAQITFGPSSGIVVYPPEISAFAQDLFHWEIRFTANSIGTRQGLVSRDQSGNDESGHLGVWIEGNGTIRVRNQGLSGQPSTVLNSTSIVSVDQEHTILVSVSDQGIGLWVDGTLEAYNAVSYGLTGNSLPLVLGGLCNTCLPDGSVPPASGLDGTVYLEIHDDPLALPEPPAPVSAVLSWSAPTHYEDCAAVDPAEKCGQPIPAGELERFNVYLVTPSRELLRTVAGDVQSYEYVSTGSGEHCFEVTAVAGTESDRSNTACRTF